MELWATKVLSLSLMLIATLILGVAPVCFIFKNRERERLGGTTFQNVLSYINCVVGGVFLGTTMLHLLPEVKEQTEDLLNSYGINTNFAVAEFLVSLGFFIVMFIEHFIMSLQHHHNDVPLGDREEEKALLKSQSRGYGTLAVDNKTKGTETLLDNPKRSSHTHSIEHDPEGHAGGHTEQGQGRSYTTCDHQAPIVLRESDCVHIIHPSHHEHHHIQDNQLAGVRSFILLLAMSLHTVFEGLAIGLQKTSTDTWNLFIAIIAHKVVIAFSLGVNFAGNLRHFGRAMTFVVLFALMSPIGVAIGTVVQQYSAEGASSSEVASCVLQALATGTFIYVAFFEVLMKEVGQNHGLLKVFCVILGYSLMTLLNLFNGEPKN